MKKVISIILPFILVLTFISPSISHAAEPNINNSELVKLTDLEPTIEPASSEEKNETLEACLRQEVKLQQTDEEFSGDMSTYQLPGDFTNLCKVVATKNINNVTYNNYEQKILKFLIGGGIGVINYFTKGVIQKFVTAGAFAVFPSKVPKSKDTWVTTQRRECKDSTGIHTYLIIKYYKDSKRTNQLYVQYKKA
ncbi:hypothetical protein [Rummeliibacillus sp. SL167]|uniref:hypothetical protein n=1 Tax=Rummeliibacillus sp. SL167 TaxID=2579792 RepID=UPI0011B3D390|nr:hypothetical protein [Rummeliibacillus sp. SL167]